MSDPSRASIHVEIAKCSSLKCSCRRTGKDDQGRVDDVIDVGHVSADCAGVERLSWSFVMRTGGCPFPSRIEDEKIDLEFGW